MQNQSLLGYYILMTRLPRLPTRMLTHKASCAAPFVFAWEGVEPCVTLHIFLWLLFTLSTVSIAFHMRRGSQTSTRTRGRVKAEVGSLAVAGPFEVLLYGDPAPGAPDTCRTDCSGGRDPAVSQRRHRCVVCTSWCLRRAFVTLIPPQPWQWQS